MQYFLFYTSITVVYWKIKCSKVLNWDVHGTSTGPNCWTSWGTNDGTFKGRQSYMLFKFNSETL